MLQTDLTQGAPLKQILRFSLPVLAGNVFQQLYAMVDTLIVGRCLGNRALAAVGSTGSLSFLVLGFALGLASGFSVVAAQRFGAQDEEGVRRSVATSVLLCSLISALFTAGAVLTAEPILRLMNTPADIFDSARTYITVIFAGLSATIFYNMIAGILRALGDSRTPLLFLVFSSFLNIGLDLLFILPLSMGVAGAALATVLSQLVSAVLCVFYARKHFPILRIRRRHFGISARWWWAHLRLGLPMALQYAVTAVGIMVLQSAVNAFGSGVVAAFTAANKTEILIVQPFSALSVTMSAYCGQNYGAKDVARLKKGLRCAGGVALIWAVVAAVLTVLAGVAVSALFLEDPNPEILRFSRQYLMTITPFYLMLGLLFIHRDALQAMNAPGVPMLGGVLELAARGLVCAFLPAIWGFGGVCLATPIAWTAAAMPLTIRTAFLLRRFAREGFDR